MKYVREIEGAHGTDKAMRLLDEEVSPSDEYTDELHRILSHLAWVSDRDGSISIEGDIHVEPGQWIVVFDDGSVEVMDHTDFCEQHGAV